MHQCDERFLLTVAALDCYREHRKDEAYWGLLPTSHGTVKAIWPTSRKPKIFAYLSTNFPFVKPLIHWLQQHFVGHIFIAGKNAAQFLPLSTPALQLSSEAYSLRDLVPNCDLVLCHGGSNTVAQALMAAKPTICIPLQREQQFTAECIAHNKLGEFITPQSSWVQLQEQLDPILTKLPSLQICTQTFQQQFLANVGAPNTAINIFTRCAELLKK
jgi:hypothetical protein